MVKGLCVVYAYQIVRILYVVYVYQIVKELCVVNVYQDIYDLTSLFCLATSCSHCLGYVWIGPSFLGCVMNGFISKPRWEKVDHEHWVFLLSDHSFQELQKDALWCIDSPLLNLRLAVVGVNETLIFQILLNPFRLLVQQWSLGKEVCDMRAYTFLQVTLKCGANGLSISGFASSDTRARSMPEMDPKSALLFPQVLVFPTPWETIAARPHRF